MSGRGRGGGAGGGDRGASAADRDENKEDVVAGTRGRGHLNPSKFSGQGQDVEEWLREFETAGRCNQWDPNLHLWVMGYLEGPAKTWWSGVDYGAKILVGNEQKEITKSWDAFKLALKNTFQPPLYKDKLRSELARKIMLPSETVELYAVSLMSLISKVDDTMKDSDKL